MHFKLETSLNPINAYDSVQIYSFRFFESQANTYSTCKRIPDEDESIKISAGPRRRTHRDPQKKQTRPFIKALVYAQLLPRFTFLDVRKI